MAEQGDQEQQEKNGGQEGQGKKEQGKKDQGKQKQGKQKQGSNPLETAATWVSGALLLAAGGWLVYEGVRPSDPPRLTVEVGEVRETFTRYYLPLRVANDGGEAAHQATVGVELLQDGRRVAAQEVTLPWVPARSSREASVVFDLDPRRYNVKATVSGFVRP